MRIPESELASWARKYSYPLESSVENIVAKVREQRYLTRDDLLLVGRWKTPRITPYLQSNDEVLVRECTWVALNRASEELRILTPMTLKGVSWPVSSVLLHWFHVDPYPLLDVRATWSLGLEDRNYSVEFWLEYTNLCRRLASMSGLSMRELDRALWQFSKENQG